MSDRSWCNHPILHMPVVPTAGVGAAAAAGGGGGAALALPTKLPLQQNFLTLFTIYRHSIYTEDHIA